MSIKLGVEKMELVKNKINVEGKEFEVYGLSIPPFKFKFVKMKPLEKNILDLHLTDKNIEISKKRFEFEGKIYFSYYVELKEGAIECPLKIELNTNEKILLPLVLSELGIEFTEELPF